MYIWYKQLRFSLCVMKYVISINLHRIIKKIGMMFAHALDTLTAS